MDAEQVIAEGQRWLDEAAAAQAEGRPDEALAGASRAVEVLTRGLGPDDPNVAPALVAVGHLRADRGDDAGAAESYAYAVSLLEPLREDEDALDLELEASVALAHAWIALARYDDVRALLEVTLDLATRRRGERAVVTAFALNALGKLCKYTGRFDEGVGHYHRALEILEAEAPDADEVIAVLHNLGGIHHAAGDFATAEPFARRAVELRAARTGEDSLFTAIEMAAWAPVLDALGRTDEAVAIYRRVVPIFRREGRTYDLACALHNVADHEPDPEATWREAIALKVGLLGEEHPDVALTVHNLGVWLADRRPVEARALARQAVATLARTLGDDHPHTRAARAALADLA